MLGLRAATLSVRMRVPSRHTKGSPCSRSWVMTSIRSGAWEATTSRASWRYLYAVAGEILASRARAATAVASMSQRSSITACTQQVAARWWGRTS